MKFHKSGNPIQIFFLDALISFFLLFLYIAYIARKWGTIRLHLFLSCLCWSKSHQLGSPMATWYRARLGNVALYFIVPHSKWLYVPEAFWKAEMSCQCLSFKHIKVNFLKVLDLFDRYSSSLASEASVCQTSCCWVTLRAQINDADYINWGFRVIHVTIVIFHCVPSTAGSLFINTHQQFHFRTLPNPYKYFLIPLYILPT